MNIIDESYKHAGHSGNPSGDPNAETHFKQVVQLVLLDVAALVLPCSQPQTDRAHRRLEIVSSEFDGKRLVQRHQMVYRLLDEELKNGVHALSMDTKTPAEAGLS